jgi:hypothetical protein
MLAGHRRRLVWHGGRWPAACRLADTGTTGGYAEQHISACASKAIMFLMAAVNKHTPPHQPAKEVYFHFLLGAFL